MARMPSTSHVSSNQLSHGIASLFARGESSQRKLPMSAEDLLEAQLLIYLKGLGLDPSAR